MEKEILAQMELKLRLSDFPGLRTRLFFHQQLDLFLDMNMTESYRTIFTLYADGMASQTYDKNEK